MEAVLCLSIVTSSGTLDQRCGTLRDGRFVPGNGSLASLITSSLFDRMLKHRDDAACPAKGFYTYDAFVAAAAAFRGFATTGDADTRKREVAAFLAQTSHETTGGWATAPDGPFAWGFCYLQEQGDPSDYCLPSSQYPCAAGKKYYGRGPFQISYNYNYESVEEAIGMDLLSIPELVTTDRVISFKTTIFWMMPQSPKPSCHEVIVGKWTSSDVDRLAGRVPGYGTVTNIINGGVECGKGFDANCANRIRFYKRYCDILGVSYGDHLYCYRIEVTVHLEHIML
ncbi:26 kDa endochitinase 2-like [Musa acuminata AAA Group]|uniref:26 kDa endochitinase 2-like n=1 Tax=Musa acuminata AAA Group TaxID=214697 RepID=UPI0031E0FEBE